MAAHRFPTDIDILRPIQLSGTTQHSKYVGFSGTRNAQIISLNNALFWDWLFDYTYLLKCHWFLGRGLSNPCKFVCNTLQCFHSTTCACLILHSIKSRGENLQIIIWFQIFCNSQDHSCDQCESTKKILREGGGVRVLLGSGSGWRCRASDFQSVKVFGLCFTRMGWLFIHQMWKILWLLGTLHAQTSPAWQLYAPFRFFCKSMFSSLKKVLWK